MKPTKTPKERKKLLLHNFLLFLVAIAMLTVLAVIGKPETAELKTPMPTDEDSLVNRECESIKCIE